MATKRNEKGKQETVDKNVLKGRRRSIFHADNGELRSRANNLYSVEWESRVKAKVIIYFNLFHTLFFSEDALKLLFHFPLFQPPLQFIFTLLRE
jgi:hypothetical protein